MSRTFVAMSGGVDSSLAAALLQQQGEDVVGVWMRLTPAGFGSEAPRCCGTSEAGEQARRAAAHLGIPFYALDYAELFGREVVERFVRSYANAETPNPCVACNQHVKFDALLRDVIGKFGADRLATGHYARITVEADGTRRLRRARDAEKDQSYALYALGQPELARLVLPIGELRDKSETRELARSFGLPNATTPESMDICFIGGDYRSFVRARAPEAFVPGAVERTDGAPVGQHGGIGTLTVGQRAGVGVATGERLYVLRLEPERNAAVVGTRDEIAQRLYRLRDLRWSAGAPLNGRPTTVALRYRGSPLGCVVRDGMLELDEPALVAPGQAAVFYEGDVVLGGGVIDRAA
ncbi:MAG TPA: tRNA 2-thiouridine(34) synthase MnmA [Candidatus Limnocylindria bacterium]|nr:tRNA 2-thiouridine(34) synthase MnmA [Candidatus Limnocylindria bacterium]